MRILYIADDDTIFDNEFDCEEYEFMKHVTLDLFDTVFFDENKQPMKNIHSVISEELYNTVWCIYVPTLEAAKAMQEVGDYTGFAYNNISEAGFWAWNDETQSFEKIDGEGYNINRS